MFGKKKEKLDDGKNVKRGCSQRSLTFIVFIALVLIGMASVLLNVQEDDISRLATYFKSINQDVNISLTDPISNDSLTSLKNKMLSAGLETLGTSENITFEAISTNTEKINCDLNLTQNEVGSLFNIVLKDDVYAMHLIQLLLNVDNGEYSFYTYIKLDLTPFIGEVSEDAKPYIPQFLTMQFDAVFIKNNDGLFETKESFFKILNFSDDINETVTDMYEEALGGGKSIKSTINDSILFHLNNKDQGVMSWFGASDIELSTGRMLFKESL